MFLACIAEKTLDYCSCEPNYNWTSANGAHFSSQGGCIQDDPNIPPWCLVVAKSCSQPPPKKPDGQAWDICRGASPPPQRPVSLATQEQLVLAHLTLSDPDLCPIFLISSASQPGMPKIGRLGQKLTSRDSICRVPVQVSSMISIRLRLPSRQGLRSPDHKLPLAAPASHSESPYVLCHRLLV